MIRMKWLSCCVCCMLYLGGSVAWAQDSRSWSPPKAERSVRRLDGQSAQRWLPMPQVEQSVDPAKQAELLQTLRGLVGEADRTKPPRMSQEQMEALQQAAERWKQWSGSEELPNFDGIPDEWISQLLESESLSGKARDVLERFADDRRLPLPNSRSSGKTPGVPLPPTSSNPDSQNSRASNRLRDPNLSARQAERARADDSEASQDLSQLSQKLGDLMRSMNGSDGREPRSSPTADSARTSSTDGRTRNPAVPNSRQRNRPTADIDSSPSVPPATNSSLRPIERGAQSRKQTEQSSPPNRPIGRAGNLGKDRVSRSSTAAEQRQSSGTPPKNAPESDIPDFDASIFNRRNSDSRNSNVPSQDSTAGDLSGRAAQASDLLEQLRSAVASNQQRLDGRNGSRDSDTNGNRFDPQTTGKQNGQNGGGPWESGLQDAFRRSQNSNRTGQPIVRTPNSSSSSRGNAPGAPRATSRTRTFDSNLDIRSQVERHGFGRTLQNIVDKTLKREGADRILPKPTPGAPPSDRAAERDSNSATGLTGPNIKNSAAERESASRGSKQGEIQSRSTDVRSNSVDRSSEKRGSRQGNSGKRNADRRSGQSATSKGDSSFSSMAASFWDAVKEPGSSQSNSSTPVQSGGNSLPDISFRFGAEQWITLAVVVGLLILLWRLRRQFTAESIVRKAEARWVQEALKVGLKTRADVVRAYHDLVLHRPRPAADWWTHRYVARHLPEVCPTRLAAIQELSNVYEAARYLPPEHPLDSAELERVQNALRKFEAASA